MLVIIQESVKTLPLLMLVLVFLCLFLPGSTVVWFVLNELKYLSEEKKKKGCKNEENKDSTKQIFDFVYGITHTYVG